MPGQHALWLVCRDVFCHRLPSGREVQLPESNLNADEYSPLAVGAQRMSPSLLSTCRDSAV